MNCCIGCNEYQMACPHNIPLSIIFRYNYYFKNKQQEKYAIEKYQRLPDKKANVCLHCEGYCEDACPHGVATRLVLNDAHQNFSFSRPYFT